VSKPVAPRRIETDIAQVAREVTAMAQANRAEGSGILIRHRADATVFATVDEDQIRQVLWNLLKNAIQASPKGSSIDIAVDQTNDEVILSVTDQGVGIDPSQRDRIFDMFYSERTHGAGIGLALVRQIVDGHGGSIEAAGNPGPGATFRVTLPKRPPVRDSASPPGT
jgi:signal transduction histidine kinase